MVSTQHVAYCMIMPTTIESSQQLLTGSFEGGFAMSFHVIPRLLMGVIANTPRNVLITLRVHGCVLLVLFISQLLILPTPRWISKLIPGS